MGAGCRGWKGPSPGVVGAAAISGLDVECVDGPSDCALAGWRAAGATGGVLGVLGSGGQKMQVAGAAQMRESGSKNLSSPSCACWPAGVGEGGNKALGQDRNRHCQMLALGPRGSGRLR